MKKREWKEQRGNKLVNGILKRIKHFEIVNQNFWTWDEML